MRRFNWYQLSLIALAVPIAEFVFFRYFLHSVLGIKIGWGALWVDADIIVPGIAAFVLYIFTLTHERQHSVYLQRKAFFLHLVFGFLFLTINLNYQSLNMRYGAAFSQLWWGNAIAFFVSSFFIFLSFAFYVRKGKNLALVLCITMAFSVVLGKHVFEVFWQPILRWLMATSCPMIDWVVPEHAVCKIAVGYKGNSVLRIQTPSLLAFVGKPCSGLDGILFFLNLSVLVWFQFRRKISFLTWLAITLPGLAFVFLLNTFRIAFLYCASFWLNMLYPSTGPVIFEKFFHNHVGWLFYVGFALAYFGVLLPKSASEEERTYPLESVAEI